RMTAGIKNRRAGEQGFTLIEAIIALALTGLVLSALASITAQWLPNWNRGIDRIQRGETIGIALQRIGADLAAAEYVSANRSSRRPLFDGSELSVTFVRTALGPNVGPGLDVVRLGETTDRREFVTVRSRRSMSRCRAIARKQTASARTRRTLRRMRRRAIGPQLPRRDECHDATRPMRTIFRARLRDRRRALDSRGVVVAGDDLLGVPVRLGACAGGRRHRIADRGAGLGQPRTHRL